PLSPWPTFLDQTTFGPLAGNVETIGVPRYAPFLSGPKNCGQSAAKSFTAIRTVASAIAKALGMRRRIAKSATRCETIPHGHDRGRTANRPRRASPLGRVGSPRSPALQRPQPAQGDRP